MEGRERELFDLLEPVVRTLGFDLVEVGRGSARGGVLVRVVIHSPGGVSIGDCARVDRALGPALEGALDGAHTLEVSSPGTDRVLRERREFDLFRGLGVRVLLTGETAERTGTCAGTRDEGQVVLREEDGRESAFSWSSVTKARLHPGEALRPGGKRK
ncbi:MAG: ribosome maturation factor RimP [Candidatus Eiseniibacteriota bacterium]